MRFQPVEKITACWSQSDSLDDKIYFSTEDHHLCEKLHLDIGSTAAACLPVCHWQDTFSAWLLVLPNASIRSVRHVSTIVALSVAEVGVAERSGFGAPGRSSLQNIKRLGLAGWLLLFYIYIVCGRYRGIPGMPPAPIEELKNGEALGHHYQALSKTHETLSRQLQSARDNRSVTNRQELMMGWVG